MVLTHSRHYMRYLRHDQGETSEDIARTEGVSIKAIERSLQLVRMHRAIHSAPGLNVAVIGMLQHNVDHASAALGRRLNAKEFYEHKFPDGHTEMVEIEDRKTQLRALEIFGRYVESVQPKAPGNVVKIQQNNANVTPEPEVRSGGFEEVLHGIIGRVREANQLPYKTADVVESEEEEGEEEGEEDEEA